MSVKNFGSTIIIIGFFISFIMFAYSDWTDQLSLFGNIRFSTFMEIDYDCDDSSSLSKMLTPDCKKFYLPLGQALILPIFIIIIGIMINKRIISNKFILKIFPFLSEVDAQE